MTSLVREFKQLHFQVVAIVARPIEGDRHSACQHDGVSINAVGDKGQEVSLAIASAAHDGLTRHDARDTLVAASEFYKAPVIKTGQQPQPH